MDDFIIIPLKKEDLGEDKIAFGDIGWNGVKPHKYYANHLGIYDSTARTPRKGISVRFAGSWDWNGWGFAHKTYANDKQYYTWDGEESDVTKFDISVTSAPLTKVEKDRLLH